MKEQPKKRGRPAKAKLPAKGKPAKPPKPSQNVNKASRIDPKDEKAEELAELYMRLTKGQIDFVHNFIQADFKNATECYCNAFPETSREAATSSASSLLMSPNIRACIALELEVALGAARTGLEKRIMDTWIIRAFYDVAEIINEEGALSHTMKELKSLGLSTVIDGIDIKPDKDGNEHIVYKLADKDRALDMLQKYIQMIKQPDQKIKGTGPDGKPFSYVVSFEDAEE
jgi:hypothetical protein